MISRYTREEMGQIWTSENRFAQMLTVEKAVAQIQGDLGIIPKTAAGAIAKRGRFKLERIEEIEKETKHDVIAFISSVAESVGPHGRFVHFGLTSSDVLDTATSLQIGQAYRVLIESIRRLEKALKKQIKTHSQTLCAGRTHGVHAEPTVFGLKLAGYLAELRRNRERVKKAVEQISICKLSGAVGTYSSQTETVEKKVAKVLKLEPELIATQVVPRDRHAEVIVSLSMLGAGLERLAIEIRHLQRTEVGEAQEGFSKGQKGSSAMPHKRNPISTENISGLARLLRSYSVAALEDIALWHERDISHSSVERVIFPDTFILADYAADRMASVIENLVVNPERMIENLDISQGQIFSSHVLLALLEKGMTREDAYKKVQTISHSLKIGDNLKDKLSKDTEVQKFLSEDELEEIFSGRKHKKAIEKVIGRIL